jgi:DNA replication protein DnaC
VGKTHLAVAALKELLRRGHQGIFCDYRELLKEIQASYNPASESTEMKILEPIRNTGILVIDDIGASKPSAWVLDIIGLS